jgi:hypothetical protein
VHPLVARYIHILLHAYAYEDAPDVYDVHPLPLPPEPMPGSAGSPIFHRVDRQIQYRGALESLHEEL